MVKRTIHDPLHGSIVFEGMYQDILDRHEMQRLHCIRQLGMGSIVFPGANHTRFEHSIGVYHLSGKMADALGIEGIDRDTVRAAGLLHDICHPPFSHTMEELMENATGLDHMDLARKLITGDMPYYQERDEDLLGGMEPISEILEAGGISPSTVCDLIAYPVSKSEGLGTFMSDGTGQSFFASKDHLHQIIHGPVDADQMDYLKRDAHFTGVAYGTIDSERLMIQMKIHNNKLVLTKGGIVAAEGLMVSRALMYSSVYYHKTVRIAEMMMNKAAEVSDVDLAQLYLMSDDDMVSALIASGGKASNLVRRVLNRRLYKKAFVAYTQDLTEDDRAELTGHSGYAARKKLEYDIASRAGVDYTEVNVDIPSKSTLLSNIKIGKTDVSILDDGKVRSITRFSPLSKGLQARDVYDWSVMISAPAEHVDAVRRAASKILSLDNTDGSQSGDLV